MTAIVAFALIVLFIRGFPPLFNLTVRKLSSWWRKRRTRGFKALPPPRDTDGPWH